MRLRAKIILVAVIIFALASSLCYGVADFIGGFASRKTSALHVAAVSQPVGFCVLLLAFPFFHGVLRVEDLAWGVLSGLAYAAGVVFFYTALARSRMAVVSPLSAVVGASVPVLFGYIVGERPSFWASVGVGAALLAVALLSGNPAENRLSMREPGIVPALASGVGFGLSLLFLSRSSHETGLWALMAGQISCMVVLVIWVLKRPAPFHPDRGLMGLIALTGAIGTCGGLLFVLALRLGVLPVVAVLVSLYPLSTVLLACGLLRERLSPVQWTGILCALSGTAFIARGSP